MNNAKSLNADNAIVKSSPESIETKSTRGGPVSQMNQNKVVFNSLLAGSAAGVASTIAVHPFDVIRVRMQSSAPAAITSATMSTSRTAGLVETLRNTLHYGGGTRALYTGLAMPLAAQAIYKGTIFTVNNMTESFIRDRKVAKNTLGRLETPKLSFVDRFISGFMAGAVNAVLFCTPVEYVRNQQIAQIVNHSNPTSTATIRNSGSKTSNKYNKSKGSGGIFAGMNKNGPIAVVRRTIQVNGFSGLWRGATVTVLRDSIGCGFFFSVMAYSQEHLFSTQTTQPPQTLFVILSGALAGVSFWIWALPIDTMKTWIQNGTARNISDAFRISQRNGLMQSIPSLFRGWQVAYSRGAPSAAITVLTYSIAFQHLQSPHQM